MFEAGAGARAALGEGPQGWAASVPVPARATVPEARATAAGYRTSTSRIASLRRPLLTPQGRAPLWPLATLRASRATRLVALRLAWASPYGTAACSRFVRG